MGQNFARGIHQSIPSWVRDDLYRVQVEIKKDFSLVKKELLLVKDVASLDYDSLRLAIAELNAVLRSCCGTSDERVLFGLQSQDVESYLWKTSVRIVCFKINVNSRTVVVTRTLNVHRFWRVRYEIIHELKHKELLEQPGLCDFVEPYEVVDPCEDHTSGLQGPSGSSNCSSSHSPSSRQRSSDTGCSALTTSTVLARVEQIGDEVDDECIICMDRKSEVSLPCAHSFCRDCISQWSDEHRTCPTCRNRINTQEDFWEFTNAPDMEEMNRHLLELASGK